MPTDSSSNIWYSNLGSYTSTNGQWRWAGRNQNIQLPEPIALSGPWVLHFNQQNTGIGRDTLTQLISLHQSSDDRIKYYSGNVVYATSFSIPPSQIKNTQRLILDLGKVKEIAEVRVNGKKLGIYWHTPFAVDITSAVNNGENFLEIEVVNTINNRLIGDSKLPEQYRRMKSNITKLPNAWMKPFAEAPLLEAGLIGPVRIRFAEKLGE